MQITTTVEVTKDMLADQCSAAWAWTFSTWACLTDRKIVADNGCIDTAPAEGGYWELCDAEEQDEGERFRVDEAALERGLKVMAEKYPTYFQQVLDESGDAITGDVLIQCACFGDVIYG